MTDPKAAEASSDDAVQKEPAANKHIPWQMEWKHPEWIVASNNTEDETDSDETENCQIVGITSAKLSSLEASRILSHSNSKEHSNRERNSHYLLTVSLLGIPVDEVSPSLEGENNNKQKSLASEVLLQVVEVANHDSSQTICSKRLRWPESIFDVAPAKANPSSSKRNLRQRTKRKNLLEKVFLPLMGIDEEDEYEPATNRLPKQQQQQQPTIGIVSATLCRRPTELLLEKSKEAAMQDIVDLMSFGDRGVIGNADPSSQNDENAAAAAREADETKMNDSTITESIPPSTGELSFVCVSQAGEVFVYDPIQLLLGISGQETEATKNLEEASNFFFGQELFQNLQETWKPLAEPSTRIHLSIFEHDQKTTNKAEEERLVQSNQELMDMAQPSTKDNQSTSSSQPEEPHKQQIGSEHSLASGGSSIVTSATDAMTVVQTMAIELQTNVDEALSVLPYLLNPLLEASTLKDRTVQNRPHAIDVSGNSYLVVIGSGVKKKDRSVSKPARSTGNASVSLQSYGDTVSSRGGPQKSIANEGDTVSSQLDVATNADENFENVATETNVWWEEDQTSDQQETAIDSNTPQKSNKNKSIEEANIESATENGEKNDSADQNQENTDEINIESVTDNDDRASNDREDSIEGKGLGENYDHDAIEEDEENSQRHYFDGYEDIPEKARAQDRGGFVTFLSTARWSETRTLFLPFVPIRTSHISKWNGMELLWVIGEFESLLIRMDSSGPVPVRIRDIMFGGEPLDDDNDLFQSGRVSNNSSRTGRSRRLNELSPLFVKRFQTLPIDMGTATSLSPRLLCASSTGIDPPSILELYIDHQGQHSESNEEGAAENESAKHEQALVLLKTLSYCTLQGTVVLRHAPSNVAKIIVDPDKTPTRADSSGSDLSVLAEHGQGWSLVGINGGAHFICWEGSTLLHGAYVQELKHSADFQNLHSTHILSLSMTQEVPSAPRSPSYSNSKILEDTQKDEFNDFTFVGQFQEGDDLYSPHDSSGGLLSSSKSTLSRRQSSENRLQRCSSWSQLEDTSRDHIQLDMQEPILCLRGGKTGSPHSMLSLRQLVVENGKYSPFEQVLAWLAKRKNFFVAAGIALDLLKDGDSLYHLWKNAEMIDEEDEETKLFGLLDGIAPVKLLEDGQTMKKHTHSVTATHLSDMTVGCFIKGGASMAKTLERFLEFNESYDPERVSLMLSITTIDLFSDNSIRSTKAEISPQNEEVFQQLLWPIKCLLTIGTEREYLHEVLTLLNNTIPHELRNRYSEDEKEENEAPKPSLALTKTLIRLILESDDLALEILMSFVDQQSQTSFWQSLDQSTRLVLSLMDIDSSFPFLRHLDVRAWAREELDKCFQGQSDLPTAWLQELSLACLQNANCNLNDLTLIDNNDKVDDAESSAVSNLKVDMEKTRNALMPSSDNGYEMDFDLLIPSLLLLENRNVCWQPSSRLSTSTTKISVSEDSYVSTQSLLNAACHLAGRSSGTDMASPFLFDGKSAMKQCYQVKNVVAGAYLIGGKNGFILHVSDVLHQGIGMSIPDAERFLLNDQLDLKIIEESKVDGASFELTSGHQTLLLLLEEHVLGIKTFGDFDVAHSRGKVDPVFAARSVLRAWLSLSLDDKASASSWLGNWLENRLGISSAANSEKANKSEKNQDSVPSRHRLACATLARSLLWPSNQGAIMDDNALSVVHKPLASTMGFENKLLIELCQSCLGLVESVPPSVVREIQI